MRHCQTEAIKRRPREMEPPICPPCLSVQRAPPSESQNRYQRSSSANPICRAAPQPSAQAQTPGLPSHSKDPAREHRPAPESQKSVCPCGAAKADQTKEKENDSENHSAARCDQTSPAPERRPRVHLAPLQDATPQQPANHRSDP